MKSFKFLLIALLSGVLFTSVASATKIESSEYISNSDAAVIREQIITALSGISVENNIPVYVLFSVDSETGFQVLETESLDKRLAKLVQEELKESNISAPSSLSGKYLIKIRFVD